MSGESGARYFRTTARGVACIELGEGKAAAAEKLSGHLHDVLVMCKVGLRFSQLRQFMPPRSLQESIQALLDRGLLELVDAGRGGPDSLPMEWAGPPMLRPSASAGQATWHGGNR